MLIFCKISSIYFEETQPGYDVCHQHYYIRAAKTGMALAHIYKVCILPNLGLAKSGPTAAIVLLVCGHMMTLWYVSDELKRLSDLVTGTQQGHVQQTVRGRSSRIEIV